MNETARAGTDFLAGVTIGTAIGAVVFVGASDLDSGWLAIALVLLVLGLGLHKFVSGRLHPIGDRIARENSSDREISKARPVVIATEFASRGCTLERASVLTRQDPADTREPGSMRPDSAGTIDLPQSQDTQPARPQPSCRCAA